MVCVRPVRRPWGQLASVATVLTAILAGCTSSGALPEDDMGPKYTGPMPAVTAAPPRSNDPACRSGDPLAGVYHPQRLQVIQNCISVTGTGINIKHEQDGDYHSDVRLDPPYANLENDRNTTQQGGAPVVEIIPADQAKAGERVQVTGPYVLDQDHGWMEIHSVWGMAGAK